MAASTQIAETVARTGYIGGEMTVRELYVYSPSQVYRARNFEVKESLSGTLIGLDSSSQRYWRLPLSLTFKLGRGSVLRHFSSHGSCRLSKPMPRSRRRVRIDTIECLPI